MIAAVCKRHGLVACHQCSPRIPFNQISTENPHKWTKEDKDKWDKVIDELNKQPIQFLSVWNTDKVIEFVNWYVDLKDLGENNKLENKTIIDSFLDGDSVNDWKFPQKYSFLEDRFVWDSEEEVFKSKNKWRGLGSGDDKTLYIYSDEFCTNVWWKENRGFETTIFDGKELKTEEEFNQLFEFLGIKEILKWI